MKFVKYQQDEHQDHVASFMNAEFDMNRCRGRRFSRFILSGVFLKIVAFIVVAFSYASKGAYFNEMVRCGALIY
ncbi:hypothetical protein [Peribacillus butanolivorans]